MYKPSLKKNYVYKTLYEVLAIACPFITTPYISRIFGPALIGDYSYTSSIVAYFTLFAALGTSSYGARTIAQCRDNLKELSKNFWEIEFVTLITTTVCLTVWLVLAKCYHQYSELLIALTPMLLATLFDISWFFTGCERVGYTVFINSLSKVVGVILTFTLIKTKGDLLTYVVIQSCTHMFGNLSMWLFLPKLVIKPSRKIEIIPHFKNTLIYFVPSIAISIYTVLDKTIIGLITKDPFQNGYYEQANKIIAMSKTFVFLSFNSVMSARISYLFSEEKLSEIKIRLCKSIDIILFLAFGCLFGIVALDRLFVPVFFGTGYEQSIPILNILAILLPVVGISSCLNRQYLTPVGKVKTTGMIVSFGAIVNLILNILLIPNYGAIGAAIASVIAETIITITFILKCGDILSFRFCFGISWKKVLSGIVMTFAIFAIIKVISLPGYIEICMSVFIGSIIYECVLLLLKDKTAVYLLNLTENGIMKITHMVFR